MATLLNKWQTKVISFFKIWVMFLLNKKLHYNRVSQQFFNVPCKRVTSSLQKRKHHKICFNLQFLCNAINKNVVTFKPRKQTNCNYLGLCCLIVKLTRNVNKNISYGNLVFTEQLFEAGESLWNIISKN